MTGSCGECVYWDSRSTGLGVVVDDTWPGQCRRVAPGRSSRWWPETTAGDWCGEFMIRAELLDAEIVDDVDRQPASPKRKIVIAGGKADGLQMTIDDLTRAVDLRDGRYVMTSTVRKGRHVFVPTFDIKAYNIYEETP